MADGLSKLESVLWDLLNEHLEDLADELTPEVAQRISRLVADTLETADSPNGRDPYQIADWIYWNCESASRVAAERWLVSLTEKDIVQLRLGDVLAALAPGHADQINELA